MPAPPASELLATSGSFGPMQAPRQLLEG